VRKAVIDRKTAETHVKVALTLEGRGRFQNSTGVRFFWTNTLGTIYTDTAAIADTVGNAAPAAGPVVLQ